MNNNPEILTIVNKLVTDAANDISHMENKIYFLHDVAVVEWCFRLAHEVGIDLDTKLPEFTRKGNSSLAGRTISFFTDAMDELNRRTGKKCRTVFANTHGSHRGVEVTEVEEFISVVKRKLGLIL